MDLFEFDFFRDWELEQQCHYEPDRSALKKKEWERRTQEVQQDEDLFSSGFNLFGEPYKTSKGDALASRVQNTLGNYDEMKELLTSQSNQSHLVGIPKSSVPQTPVEKSEQPSFFSEGQRSRSGPSQSATSMPPPVPSSSSSSSSSSMSGSTLMHGHQGSKKSRTSDWSAGGQQTSGAGPLCGRSKHGGASHDTSQGRHEDLFGGQGETHKGDASPAASSSHSRRHGPPAKAPPADPAYKEVGHSKSPGEPDPSAHGSSSPVASTSLLPSGLSTPTFPQGLHCKPSAVQQKPTAYVRPMDGQDQVPNDSPELKPPVEIGDGYNPSFGGLMDGKAGGTTSKSKLPKLTLPSQGEVGLPGDSSCVEDILREMTHSWPPPLTAIHTPGKAEQTKFPIPSKDTPHLTSGYNGQKRCSIPSSKAPSKAVPQKSMLEDDLKISSDEDDGEQAAEKTKPGSAPLSLPGPVTRSTEPGHSSGASGSSSESESSSESDSDSESSSSDSEANAASRTATPEPEPTSTNKWQLDKWLNKVNPHSKALIQSQPESQEPRGGQAEDGASAEGLPPGKGKPSGAAPPPDTKDRALLSPLREKGKPRTGQKAPEGKSARVKSPGVGELAVPRRSTGKKQPRRAEETNGNPGNTGTTPKEKEPPPPPEPPKARGKGAPRKEPRGTGAVAPPAPQDKKKHRGPSKIIPKSKEFIETESSSSECHSEPEELAKAPPPCSGPSSLGPLKPKDCGGNLLSVSSLASTSSASMAEPGAADLLEDPLFSPIPLAPNEPLSPLRDLDEVKSLWVKIELSFLSRVPGRDPPEPPPAKAEPRDPGVRHRRQSPASTPAEKPPSKSKRKHKQTETCDAVSGSKKSRLEKETVVLAPCISPAHSQKLTSTKESSKKQPKRREEKLLPPLLSPLSDEPTRQFRSNASVSVGQEGGATTAAGSSSSSSHKHRKGESKSGAHAKTTSDDDSRGKPSSGFHGNGQPDSDLWSNPPSASTDHLEPRRPKLMFSDTLHNADYYMQEAKRLKHKADALLEKFGKAVNYADGALSFIECGNAMERDPLEAKSPYTMYSETVELIRYAMRLKNFTSHSATVAEKKLAVLCYRCLSLLYLRMFKLKKDHAMKYSRTLMEYFKSSAKTSQAPSPWGSNGKSTGTPSPTSLSPSPVSSAGSSGGPAGPATGGTVVIPQRIHHMAASHVNITNNILRSYEHWDTADKLARESQEFFQELDSVMEPLTQHSSMTDLVRYIRQGLHWLRLEAHLL